jgi:hypothetical protein
MSRITRWRALRGEGTEPVACAVAEALPRERRRVRPGHRSTCRQAFKRAHGLQFQLGAPQGCVLDLGLDVIGFSIRVIFLEEPK